MGNNECCESVQKGKSEVWLICRKILEISPMDRERLFGYEDPKYILRMYEYKEAEEILRNDRVIKEGSDKFIKEFNEIWEKALQDSKKKSSKPKAE